MRDGGRGGECAEEFAEEFAEGVGGGWGHDCVAAGGGGEGLRLTPSAYLSIHCRPCPIHLSNESNEFVQVGASVGRGAAVVEPLSWGDVGGLEEVKTRLGTRDHRRDIRRDTRQGFENRGVFKLRTHYRSSRDPVADAAQRRVPSDGHLPATWRPPPRPAWMLEDDTRQAAEMPPRCRRDVDSPRYSPSACDRAAASVAGVAFLYLSAAEVYSPYVGEAERAVLTTYLRLTSD